MALYSSVFHRLQLRNEHGELRQQLAMLDIGESEVLVAPKESGASQGALTEETKVRSSAQLGSSGENQSFDLGSLLAVRGRP